MSNVVPSVSTAIASRILQRAAHVLELEQLALHNAADGLDDHFIQAVGAILRCQGRVCFTGLGKAGHIAAKVQATFASTGTLGYFLHPIEALHGDLGMVSADDVVVAFSKSAGAEIADILSMLRPRVQSIVLITATPHAPASQFAQWVVNIGVTEEACPLKLAPSSSTAAMLGIGDALAFAVMEERGFTPADYARLHPAGALGRALLTCRDVMRTGRDCPRVAANDSLKHCLAVMGQAPRRAGCVIIVDRHERIEGIATQGDLVRHLLNGTVDANTTVTAIMTSNPKRMRVDSLATEAVELISRYAIDEIPVVDGSDVLVGLIDVQDLVVRGFVLDR